MSDSPNDTLRILQALFPDEMKGFIEVRLIEDKTKEMQAAKRKPNLVGRYWYPSPAALAEDLGMLLDQAQARQAGVFFGVLPRKQRDKGTASDLLNGSVVWVDLDSKDFADGIDGLRRALARYPIEPSIIVASAHGLHAYWLIREEHEPAELSATSKRIAKALGGDHAFDAARILRLPGSLNRKDPANPILVTVEKIEPDRRYNLSELADALDMLGSPCPALAPGPAVASPDSACAATAEPAPISIAGAVSERVQLLLDLEPKVRGYFLGRGKPEKDQEGKQLDASSSGYDFSLAMSLIRNGVTDPAEIATALWYRPDGHSRAKGQRYVELTVQNAIAKCTGTTTTADAPADFKVDRALIYDSIPPQYEFVINGIALKLTAGDLKDSARFELRHLEALNRIPNLPKGKTKWKQWVNEQLAAAVRVAMPFEASEDGALHDSVARVVDNLPTSDGADIDLESTRTKFPLPDGRIAFKGETVLRRVREDNPKVVPAAFYRVLKELGHQPVNEWIGPKRVRLWIQNADQVRGRTGDADDAV